ncbi:hypothetical protein Cylst_2049 [Cylindrospermum stagnale PCC 7417]|uniref:Uncharacterized protein n=1 Tax=Cylindrospermum stagnale PCC 7417 TaxID=56107 RepID=K9WXP8_9NOST|nr:hypothetical protein [Cylindrospermum stagnale]AFZ24292.1 hypothetical protein Cylst_2049 [Cylindrospermum stagnale PCC 7417]
MSSPNFEQMTNRELRAYALAHRDELEPLRVLYSRRTPDSEATFYGPMATEDGVPIEENIRLAEKAIQKRAASDRQHDQEDLPRKKHQKKTSH